MATSISREGLIRQHIVGISLIKEDLAENVINLVKKEELLALFDKGLTDKLTDHGKTIFSAGLNEEGLNTVEDEIKKEFRKYYSQVLAIGESKLKEGNDQKQVAKMAQDQFRQSLATANTKEKLFQIFISQLADKGQSFTEEDKPHLRSTFFQYMDKTIEKHSDSLKDFQSLESVKAKMQLNDDTITKKPNASMTAQPMTNKGLITGPKVEAKSGYSINIDNLRKQLQYTLANLKPGEKVNIDVIKPDRDEAQKNMAETAFQHKTTLLSALLVFLYLGLIHFSKIPLLTTSKTEDEQRVLKAIIDLAQKYGLIMDPKDINLKISVPGRNGKNQTVFEGPLPEPLSQELNKTAAKVKTQLFPNNKPLYQTQKLNPDSAVKTEDKEEVNRTPTLAA